MGGDLSSILSAGTGDAVDLIRTLQGRDTTGVAQNYTSTGFKILIAILIVLVVIQLLPSIRR